MVLNIFHNIGMCATVQKQEAAEHVFSRLKKKQSFLLGRTFIMVTESLRAFAEWLQESVSCGIHDLQLCLQQLHEPCSNGELLFCGILVPSPFSPFFFI